MAKVEHFEIPADDIARAQAFYSEVLGFTYEPWTEEMGMLRAPGGAGINGDLHQRGATPHPTVVFTVDRLEDTIEAARARGGELIGSIEPMGENARWAYIRDSEGNLIGIYDEQPAG
ncbi:VOC family protein [Lysobacter korlensis]|uniref:VOC family protein n=1 Tax=Lysobacter korlensis TaxID=553636 RepID=A0ABV6S072_9GAMM